MERKENHTESQVFANRLRGIRGTQPTHMIDVVQILRHHEDIRPIDSEYTLDGLFFKFQYLKDGKTYQFIIKEAGNASPFTGDAA